MTIWCLYFCQCKIICVLHLRQKTQQKNNNLKAICIAYRGIINYLIDEYKLMLAWKWTLHRENYGEKITENTSNLGITLMTKPTTIAKFDSKWPRVVATSVGAVNPLHQPSSLSRTFSSPNFDSRLSPGRQNIGISSVFVPSFLWSEWCCKNLLCYRQNRGITQTRKISRQHETPKSFVDIRHELLACLFCSQNGFQEEQVL